EGRADLEFTDGPKFSVDLTARDPIYALQVSGEKMHLPMIESLIQLLPSPGDGPAGSSENELKAYGENLRYLNADYTNVNASILPCDDMFTGEPPSPTSALDGFAYSALAEGRD